MYTTKDPLCNISGGWELYLTSHRVRKADKASIHYLQSITTEYLGILLHFGVLSHFDEADETIKQLGFQNPFRTHSRPNFFIVPWPHYSVLLCA